VFVACGMFPEFSSEFQSSHGVDLDTNPQFWGGCSFRCQNRPKNMMFVHNMDLNNSGVQPTLYANFLGISLVILLSVTFAHIMRLRITGARKVPERLQFAHNHRDSVWSRAEAV